MALVEWELPTIMAGQHLKLQPNEISLNLSKVHCLTFNQTISNEVRNKNFDHIVISSDDMTGDIYLVLNNIRGLKLSVQEKGKNVKMNSSVWIKKLVRDLHLPDGVKRHVVKVSKNVSRNDRTLIYRIIQKQ